ncbi:MAG: molecular chaperone SurA [Gammaproteobacteria bacterium]|nr:molecular chaperone SurA [Gammaproteobacteria bacterium]HBX01415.1 molecular chaperone SurA [Gammaproteobacteria bacterium]|tara:strand:- start:2859 stop:4187 length:1329 start_codon:yes stop_codon:yes gene_type:complete
MQKLKFFPTRRAIARLRNWGAMVLYSLLSFNVAADYQRLEAIVAVVDDDVVLASELMARLDTVRTSMIENNVQMPPSDVLINQIMERLIIENIQLQEAEKRGVTVDDETLARAVSSFASNNNLSMEEFRQTLLADGTNYRQFREEIRSELIITRLQRAMINRRISISEQDVQALLNSPFYQQMFSDEYRVGHIMRTLADDGTDADAQAAFAEAEGFVQELRDGAEFAQMAIAKSSASTALEGGDLGWRRAGELPTLFADAVIDMQVGDIVGPMASGATIHIIKLLDQRGAGTERMAQTNVSHILIRPSEIVTNEQAKTQAEAVYERFQAGEDFAALAKEFSEDPGSALNGGALGWSTPDQFVPQFAQVMMAADIGEVSTPFESEFGWHLLLVEDRREQDMSDEARRDMAMDLLFRRRFEEERQEWLKEIRDEAFVELRLNES